MESHDNIMINNVKKQVVSDKELIKSLSPDLEDLAIDIEEIRAHSNDPLFLGILIARLIKEREKTNRILDSINEKYDKIMFELKTKEMNERREFVEDNKGCYSILSEQDQVIIDFIDKNEGATAKEIKELLGYKGLNAASQRLNKLYKDGYLKKIQSGKKVLYLIR